MMKNSVTKFTVFAMERQRLNALDKLKAICAFLIVCIHVPFTGVFGEYFTCLTRIAVPIFFMISGFFYSTDTAKNQIKKVFWLFLVSNFGYFALGLAKAVLRRDLMVYVASVFSVKKMALFLIVNYSPFAVHLWYLGAILYVYIVFYIAGKYGWEKWLAFSFPIFLMGDIMLGKYSLLLFQREFPLLLVRNWFFVGIPFFAIGLLIHNYRNFLSYKCDKTICLLYIGIFSITSILERFILVSYRVNAIRDQYISTVFLAVAVFLFFLYFVDNRQDKLTAIGRNDSTWIYIIHYAFITLLAVIMRTYPQLDIIYRLVRPVVVFFLSVLFVELIGKVCRRKAK